MKDTKKQESEIIQEEQQEEVQNVSQEKEEQNSNVSSKDHALEFHEMTRKQRRRQLMEEERAKLKELTFWRKIQYILNYYTWKFITIFVVCLILILLVRQIYIITRPVALDIVLVNDMTNEQFEDTVIELFSSYDQAPEDARYLVDINYEIHPDEAYTSATLSYYSKLMASLSRESTHIVICDSPVVDYYAIDGYMLELQNGLPEELYTQLEDRLYECDGPVEDSDYYAIDISGMEFTKRTGIQLEEPYLCIPTILNDENREIAFSFIHMILDMEE